MSLEFRAAKGCVYSVGRQRSGGFYDLSPSLAAIRLNSEGTGSAILMDGVDGGENDSIFLVKTLDKKKFLYVFGDDFGDLTIRGIALLGKSDLGGQAFNQVKRYFDTHRVSVSGKPIKVSMPGAVSLRCYLHQLIIGAPDPIHHAQPFMFRATVVTPE